MSDDQFWRFARKRVLFWLSTAIELAGYGVTPLSLSEALRSAPLSVEETTSSAFASGYLYRCLQNAERRRAAGSVKRKDYGRLDSCIAFWMTEFCALGERTRSCITFEIMGYLEQHIHGNQFGCDPSSIVDDEDLDWEDWQMLS